MPTSRATRVTSAANERNCSTIVLSVSLSCRISPRTSTVIFFDRSPLAIAVATSAMLRTWPVRLLAMKLTLSVRSFQVPATPGTCAWPPSLPSVPTSRATRVTSPAKALSWSTIVLMVFLSSRISPFTSTVILRDKSPRATAVVTSAMFRTWPVRLPAIELTESVRSFHVPATPGTCAWPPSRPSEPTSRATRVTSPANALSWSTIVLMVSFSSRISPLTFTVIFFDKSPLAMAVDTSAMLRTWPVKLLAMELTESVRSFHVPPTPGTCAWPPSLPSVPTSRATRVTSDAKERKLIHHRVHGVFEFENFAFHIDRDLARQIAARHSRSDFGDVAHLASQVAGHEVHVVGEIFPRAGDAGHLRLAAEFSFRADFAGDARDFAGERVELVHHRVDGVLEFENFAFHIDRDLARQIAAGHGRRNFGDVSDLAGKVAGHRVDGVGEILPRSGDARDVGLTAEAAFGSDFAGHARDFAGEPVELVHHRVERFFELENFAAHVDRDLARQVAAGDGGRDFGDVSHLASQVAGHEVHVVGEIFPRAADAGHLRLAAELAFGSDFAGHARHFTGECVELVHHRVDGVFQFENFALHVDRDFAGQIAAGHSGGDFGDVSHLGRKVSGHRVDGVGKIFPGAGDAGHDRLSAEFAVGADFAGHARHFRSE